MAVPTAPTDDILVISALKDAGYTTPSTAQKTRAKDDHMAEIKNDIVTMARTFAKELKSLHTTTYGVTAIGQSRYSNPTDYDSSLTITLLNGANIDTATAGSTSTVTLAADEGASESFMLGKYILITSGTGIGSASQCTAYNTTTLVATVTPDFTTAPDNGSGYMVVDEYTRLNPPTGALEIEDSAQFVTKGEPTSFYSRGDKDYGEFVLDIPPDQVYGMKLRYNLNLLNLDLASDLMTTLYQRWRNVWMAGVIAKAWQVDDDDRFNAKNGEYFSMIEAMIRRESYGEDSPDINIAPDLITGTTR